MFHIGYECIINRNTPLSSKQLQPYISICQDLCEHCNQIPEKTNCVLLFSLMYDLFDTRNSSFYFAMWKLRGGPNAQDLFILKMKEQQSQASLVTGL